jgi:dihydropyrimidinase
VPYDLVVKNGLLVTAEDSFAGDLAVAGERIAAIGDRLEAEREIDATGLYVLPGAVDGHVHFDDPTFPPFAPPTADTFATGSVAAAFGGVTTVVDFAQPAVGQPLLEELERRRSDADGETVVDYALHLNLRDPDPARLDEIPDVFARGVPSFKLYMAYEGYRLPDVAIFRAMEAVAAMQGLAILHAENEDVIRELAERLAAAGKTGPRWLRDMCPAVAEGEAVNRAIALAELAGAELLVFHISCTEGVREVAAAKARGLPVEGESTSQHLTLTDDLLQTNDLHAQSLAVRPPIRDDRHRRALWDAVVDGTVGVVSTDHCPRQPTADAHAPGASGIEVRLAVVHELGVRSGLITCERWVELCCTRPAEIFRLPRKGRLRPGYDADLVLFDPARRVDLSPETLHSPLSFSTYEGVSVTGFPVVTISRGEVIVENGAFVGKPGRGRFLERGA